MYFPEDAVSDNSRTEISEDHAIHVEGLLNDNFYLNEFSQL